MDELDLRIKRVLSSSTRGSSPEGREDLGWIRRRARRRRARRLAGVTILVVLIAAGVAVPLATLSSLRSPEPAASPVACPAQWTGQPRPVTGTRDETLHGVVAISPRDVWAVGVAGELPIGGVPGFVYLDQIRILHWNGSTWMDAHPPQPRWTYPSPFPPAAAQHVSGGFLFAVAASGPDDVWAVGSGVGPLAMRWNGSRWRVVPTANLPSDGRRSADFSGVAAVDADDAWAVGEWTNGRGVPRPLIEHWDGRGWRFVPTDDLPNGTLSAVSASGPNDVWAVGRWMSRTNASSEHTLAVHWDGRTWTRITTPVIQNDRDDELLSVASRTPVDAWAVGEFDSKAKRSRPIAMHWNGRRWQLEPLPAFPPGNAYLRGVTVGPGATALAVGAATRREPVPGGAFEIFSTLALEWSGHGWSSLDVPSVVPTTNPPRYKGEELEDVDSTTDGHIWAVGQEWVGANAKALIELGCAPTPNGAEPVERDGA
jgi:hypothetical protein